MKLINISENILVNPNCISCVEQKKVSGKMVIIVWVEGKSYTLGIPYKNFIDSLASTSVKQEFGG